MELRTYTLANAEALRQYTRDFWPRHVDTLRRYGIVVHGVWTDVAFDGFRVMALVGYRPGDDPARLAEVYARSADFIADHVDFDVSLIVSRQVRILEPIPCSPLQ
ncbi:hypothetical protein TUM20985_58200 [Mycobacterium antarcticum]|nr:NIPSNAP family protein [Mycolicibacterium sp. TUM20985]BDX35273.1 hypothetical protein TUM20985_58200 [Mycolicibacterium sp. TUM20985]